MSLDNPELRWRPPTSRVPYPFVLLEGEEGAGKTWAAAKLSTSERVGSTYWLDLGEGAADEYGAIPGARYVVLEHDGTYAQVLEQVLAVKEVARVAHENGEPPVVLVIDTMGNVWDGLKDWVSERAKAKPANQRKLAQDPAAELDVSRNLWNDAGNRYRRLTSQLLTFPGIVVGTARGKWVSDTDPSTGQPFKDGRKAYRIEGEKGLGHDATIVVRMRLGEPPQITKARSVHAGVRPTDPPVVLDGARAPKGELVDWLVFDVLKADPHSHPRNLVSMTGGALLPEEQGDEDAQDPRGPSRTVERPMVPALPRSPEGRTALDYVTGLEAMGPDRELTPAIVAEVEASGLIEEPVKFRGNSMTLGGALAVVKIEAHERAHPPARPPWEQGQDAQTAPVTASEPQAAPEEPPARAPGPQNGAQQETPEAAALDTANAALASDSPDVVSGFYRSSADLRAIDVSAAITDEDLVTIGLNPDEVRGIPVPLGGLLVKVGQYVTKHGNAVRYQGRPTAEDEPLDPWAADAAAGWPDKHTAPE